MKSLSYIVLKISHCSFSTHLQALPFRRRNIITPTPFMNLLFPISFSCFLLVKTLQFSIPIAIKSLDKLLHVKHTRKAKSAFFLHSFIELPRRYDRNGLIFSFFTENLTPRFRLFTFIMQDDWNLDLVFRKMLQNPTKRSNFKL